MKRDIFETTAVTGDWIQTYTGKPFWPAGGKEQNDHADIHDIAHALALNNRWTGHTRVPYSVAQHSVLGSYIVEPRYALAFLLHDATEAYMPDLSRPVKYQDALAGFRATEDALQHHILPQFWLDKDLPAPVKEADDAMLMAEYRDLLRGPPLEWRFVPRSDLKYTKRIVPWPWWYAEIRFLLRYVELVKGRSIFAPRLWPTVGKYLRLKVEDFFRLG